MNKHEELIIKAFFKKGRKERYFTIRNNEKKRFKWLDKLNHTPGLDERYVTWIDSKVDVLKLLKSKGASDHCYVISCSQEIDQNEMNLEEAIAKSEALGWGTIIGCIPGVLGYYYGELGESRAILARKK